ncbi:MAG: DNA-binding response regulator [Ignavibacteria bacterium]|nr:MAG: DNA-binding response regulator [Ignavibacteria bacterium]
MKKILIIEDDPAQAEGLKIALEENGYSVHHEKDGLAGYKEALKNDSAMIILDLNLPSKDGIEICRDLRANNIATPILMLTCRQDEIDKVLGLEIGADDYMTKPYGLRELLARVKALLRRPVSFQHDSLEISFGDIQVNFERMEVVKAGNKLDLSKIEFNLLKYFLFNEGKVLSRYQLLDDVWGYDANPTTRTVDNYVLQLRKKLEDIPSEPVHFLTVHGIGYKFVK